MNKRSLWNFDWILILSVGILILISLTTLLSLNPEFFKSQAIFLVIGIVAFLFFSQTNYKVLQLYSLPIYIVSFFLLLLILFLGIESRGSVRWVEVFGFSIQFSEILKPFLLLTLSSFLISQKGSSYKSFLFTGLLMMPLALLIFLQPDLGTAIIYVLVTLSIMVFFGFPFRYFILSSLPLFAAIPVVWKFMHGYQKERILTFIDPGKDPLGTSYNAIQSVIAVGSGMLLGKGFGQGTQSGLRFLPERHTDFIFASISEQLGFVGTALILICFVVILYRIFLISKNSDDRFSKIFAASIFFLILIQAFINIGMNIGVLPIVGVTLPFVSYGGSSLLSNFIILGLLSAISRNSQSQEVLEIK